MSRLVFRSGSVFLNLVNALNSSHSGLPALAKAAGMEVEDYRVLKSAKQEGTEAPVVRIVRVAPLEKSGIAPVVLKAEATVTDEGTWGVLTCSTTRFKSHYTPQELDFIAHLWMIVLTELEPLAVRVPHSDRDIFDVVDAHMNVGYY